MFQKGDKLAGLTSRYSYRVLTAHRDGTITVKALFPLTTEGAEAKCGYLGFVYDNQPADAFVRYAPPQP